MYTVTLVDDEPATLEILQNSIAWSELGVGTVSTALDGRSAMEMLDRGPTDLLITDIRMPNMDGLELLRHVRKMYPDTHCILLTAYGEFAYAKEAIRLGVENYLLKPVVKEEVEQTIKSALENIYRKQKNSEWLILDNTLKRWIQGTIDSEELGEHAAFLGINLYLPAYCAVCIVKRDPASSLGLFRSKCIEFFSACYTVFHLHDEKGRFVIILGGKSIDVPEIENTIRRAAEAAAVGTAAAAAIGEVVPEADSLSASYLAACETVDLTEPSSGELILPRRPGAADRSGMVSQEEIRILVCGAGGRERMESCRAFAKKLKRNTACGQEQQTLSRLKNGCIQAIQGEFPMQKGIRRELESLCESSGESAAAQFEEDAYAILSAACRVYGGLFGSLSPVVQYAADYIRKNCAEGISLKDFCSKNGMNAAYIGHLFKTETGTFFNDYLTGYRIDLSVIMLRNPSRKIKEIALSCGFASTSYFVRTFRKQKGLSPMKYRMQCSESGSGASEARGDETL